MTDSEIRTPKKGITLRNIFEAFNYVFLLFVIVITLFPFWYAFMASVSSPSRFIRHRGPLFLPLGFDLSSYITVLKNPNIGYGFFNSFVNLTIGGCGGVFLTLVAAYSLTRKDFFFRKPLTIMMVITMFVSGGLIPLYLTINSLHLLNTRWSVILPILLNTYNIVITRVYISSIPESLIESARLDGSNDFIILIKIIIPVSKPIISVMILFYAVQIWNAWFYAMVFLNKRNLFPVSLILREILISNDTSAMTSNVQTMDKEPIAETIKFATMMVTIIPVMVIYPFLQKYFIKGMMAGAVKE